MNPKLKIGILGAGVSGLASLKYAVEEGYDVVCFEKNSQLGGVWNGANHINGGGFYKGLKTNLPKEIMVLQSIQHEKTSRSFVSQPEILKYIQTYAKTYNLGKYIQVNHEVTLIEPLSNDPMTNWRVLVENLQTNQVFEYEFDALMIAPGRFTNKYVAKIKNAELFEGKMLHSKDFVDPEKYTNQRVLVIGRGPSGIDISKHVARYASVCYQSSKPNSYIFLPLAKNVVQKTLVDYFDASGAHFQDGSYEAVDVVIFCTGYILKLPYLTPECGVTIKNNMIKYLHQHCINIERPSMAFIGLPYRTSLFPIVDFQARYFFTYLASKFQLPHKKQMLQKIFKELQEYENRGLSCCGFHAFYDSCRSLITEMSNESGVPVIDRVIFDIMDSLHKKWSDEDLFDIIDNNTFKRISISQ